METKSQQEKVNNHMISINIDHKQYTIPKGYTLATAITSIKGINYRTTSTGSTRGPVCNMGVCYECSAFLEGKGFVRTCMIEAEEGMNVMTEVDLQQSFSDKNNPLKQSVTKHGSRQSERVKELLDYDVAIIGSGPAGLSAAEELANSSLQVVVIDEQEHIGGQIYRHIPETIRPQHSPNQLIARAKTAKSIDWYLGHTVWSVVSYNAQGAIDNSGDNPAFYQIYLENQVKIRAKKIIIATGAYDYMIPFKGWTNPGVMSAGGLQIFAKTQNFLPGKEVFLAGTHPFLLIVAKQIIEAGGKVKGIAFAQSFPNIQKVLKHGLNLPQMWHKKSELFESIRAIRKAKIPIMLNTVPVKVTNDQGRSIVELQKVSQNGTLNSTNITHKSCDIVGACYGFLTSSDLPKQLGCQMDYDDKMGGHIVRVNENMESSKKHVHVAGELTGVGGAELSEIEGRIAGLSILIELTDGNLKIKQRLERLKKHQRSWTSFAKMLGEVTSFEFDINQLLEKEQQTIVCRCEEVSYETLVKTLEKHPHISSINALKLFSRCGMGLCQGRYCEKTLSAISDKLFKDGQSKEFFSQRHPTKALTINDLVD